MSECPHCRRRLLSQASPTCNWCGREIQDAAYQQRATVAREAFFVEQALHDAASLAAIESIPVVDPWLVGDPWLDPLMGFPRRQGFAPFQHPWPMPSVLQPPPAVMPVQEAPAMAAPAAEAPAEEAAPDEPPGARFRHLEL